MRRALVGIAALAALVLVASLSIAAGARQYQFTGTVVEFDAKGKKIAVDKGGEVWEFSLEGRTPLPKLQLKKGEKVTIHYQMIAKKIEPK